MKRSFGAPLLLTLLATGCALVTPPTEAELAVLDHPPPEVQAKVDALTPAAVAWVESSQAFAAKGRPLTPAEAAYARKLGVARPQAVRIVVTTDFPMPEDEALRKEAEAHGMGSILEGGRTLGDVIFLKPRYADDTEVITHELTHVAQYQRMGTQAMVRRYMTEMSIFSYPRMPMEREAFDHQTKDI